VGPQPIAPTPSSRWPRVGVGIVILREAADGPEILLVKRGRPPRLGEWSLPGGRQEAGETVFETACREALEETGTVIRPLEIVTVIDSITRDQNETLTFHYTLVEVLAAWDSGAATAGDDADAVAWVSVSKMREWLAWDKAVAVVDSALHLWRRGAKQ
jgi:8-oxo-dGTP diphosphatase